MVGGGSKEGADAGEGASVVVSDVMDAAGLGWPRIRPKEEEAEDEAIAAYVG